jgi:TonB family protein
MYALEAEPEKSGRWRRLGVGAVIAALIGGGVIFAAKTVAPNSKLLKSVMKIAIVDYEPPKPKPRSEETPPPPKALPPKPKPKETAPAQKAATPPPPSPQPQNPGEPDIGLDSASFGSGSGGAAFNTGTSQMGDPTGRGGGGSTQPVEVNKPAPKLVEARPRPGNKQPGYSDRARRNAIEGLVVVEADIDERGRVTRAVVRNKLEPELDEETRKVVLAWAFDPATLQGKAVSSTKFLRFRFQLQ